MKLILVMLTTVISMITERQVQALFECYEHENLTGIKAQLGSSLDITSKFPNGPGACKVPANSTVIFYENINHVGGVIAFHTVKEEVILPKSFKIKSILEIGSQHKKGIYLFQQKHFQGGLFKYFHEEIEDVKGDNKFGSAVVLDESSDWTIAGRCHLTNCKRRCLVCVRRAKTGRGASFINSIDTTRMQKILTVLPGACLGQNYTGISRIAGCARKCYRFGVADKNIPCNENGDCICHSRREGKTCSKLKRNNLVKCHLCYTGVPCKKGSFKTITVKGFCFASKYKGQTEIHYASGLAYPQPRDKVGCVDMGDTYSCSCDKEYCNDDINQYLNDPNFPMKIHPNPKKRYG